MVNSLPVLTLEIDDEKLKRLEQVAKQFSEAFKMMPSGKPGVQKPNAGTNKTNGPSNPNNGNPSKGWDQLFDSWQKGMKSSGKALTQVNKALKQTTRITAGLFSTALGWGTKLAAFSTVGAGGFGLVAYKAGESLKNAQGLGLSVTEKQAITSSLSGRVSGIESLLNDLNTAKYDVNSPVRRFQQSQGINYNNSSFETLFPTLRAALKIANQHSSAGAGLNALSSMGLNLSAVQLSQLNHLQKTGGLGRYEKEVNQRERYFSGQISDRGFGNYQNLMSMFSANAYKISNSFLSTLNNLTPGLTKFSNAITEGLTKFISGPNGKALFNTIGEGFETLAKWLGSEKFQSDLKNFVDLMSNLVRAIARVVSWIANIFGRPEEEKFAMKKNNDKYYKYVFSQETREDLNKKPFYLTTPVNDYFNYLKKAMRTDNILDPYAEFSKNSNPIANNKILNQRHEISLINTPGSDYNIQWQSQIAG